MAEQTAHVGSFSTIKAKTVMRPYKGSKGYVLNPPKDESTSKLTLDLMPHFEGPVTRLPIFGSNTEIKYLIHESTLLKYFKEMEKLIPKPTGYDVTTTTLKDFLAYGEN